jgi:hypothetical protein
MEALLTRAIPSQLWSAAAAAGGLLWIIKAATILSLDEQPAYTFEIAPFLFGVASIGVVLTWEGVQPGAGRHMRYLAGLATIAGAVAAIAYILQGDDGAFGLGAMVSLLAVLCVLLYTGRAIWRHRALGDWSAIPWALGWVIVAAIPLGGAMAEIDERLLEVPILAIGLGWIVLSASQIRVSGTFSTAETG